VATSERFQAEDKMAWIEGGVFRMGSGPIGKAVERGPGKQWRIGEACASKNIVLSGQIEIGDDCRLGTWHIRQAGGHWFEPSTAHLMKAPQLRGFLPGSPQ
jgi:hypothetical protein